MRIDVPFTSIVPPVVAMPPAADAEVGVGHASSVGSGDDAKSADATTPGPEAGWRARPRSTPTVSRQAPTARATLQARGRERRAGRRLMGASVLHVLRARCPVRRAWASGAASHNQIWLTACVSGND